jgi:hemerythrin superfamily protein
MVLSRGLNSIVLQAEHIKAADEKAFCQYILQWHRLLHVHHSGEETTFFPRIEELVGEKVMAANVEQHHVFHSGLQDFVDYVEECAAGTQGYDGRKVASMIDTFGKPLIQHLGDEIPTIAGLRRFGDKMKTLPNLMQEEAEKNMVTLLP